MSGVNIKTMQLMQRIGLTGTSSLGYLPVIDGKTINWAPAYGDPEHTTIWAMGYLSKEEEIKNAAKESPAATPQRIDPGPQM